MLKEIEAKFFINDKDTIRKKLYDIGFKLTKNEILIKRKVFHNGETGKFIRVRDEGNKITMTYKSITDTTINGVEEIEITINDFNNAVELINKTNFKEIAYQETLRESWNNDEAEIDIDTWPYLQSFIEIEAKSENIVKKYAKILGFEFEKEAYFGGVEVLYNKIYDTPKKVICEISNITFNNKDLEKFLNKYGV